MAIPDAQPAIDSALPSELIREICELSARDFPSSIPRLSLVSHRIRDWVEPVLYNVLRIDEGITKPPIFLHPIAEETQIPIIEFRTPRRINMPYLRKFGHHVRHALLQGCHISEIRQILSHIPGVQHLAIWIITGLNFKDETNLGPCLDYPHEALLKKLSCDFLEIYRGFDSVPFNKPDFKEITHLELIIGTVEENFHWSRWKEISRLDKLTHLSTSGMVSIGLVARLLRNCTQLEVLIIFCFGHGSTRLWDDDSDDNTNQGEAEDELGRGSGLGTTLINPQDDPRLAIMHTPKDTNILNDWEIEARGGTSYWDVATRVVEERKDSGWSGDSFEILDFDGECECHPRE